RTDRLVQVGQIARVRGEHAPAYDCLAIECERPGGLPASSVRVPVANTAPREACRCGQRSPSEEMPEACALEPPVGVGAAGRIAGGPHPRGGPPPAAPTPCRPPRGVAGRHPLDGPRSPRFLSPPLPPPPRQQTTSFT